MSLTHKPTTKHVFLRRVSYLPFVKPVSEIDELLEKLDAAGIKKPHRKRLAKELAELAGLT